MRSNSTKRQTASKSLSCGGTEKMKDLLSTMIGRKIDLYCGGASSLRGEVVKVEGGVLYLKDDKQNLSYVAVDKIYVVWEAREDNEHRAGFISPKDIE
jgi:hypothetical protein